MRISHYTVRSLNLCYDSHYGLFSTCFEAGQEIETVETSQSIFYFDVTVVYFVIELGRESDSG